MQRVLVVPWSTAATYFAIAMTPLYTSNTAGDYSVVQASSIALNIKYEEVAPGS